MAKLLSDFIKDNGKILQNRQSRKLKAISKKADKLVVDISQWYKIDDEGEITISSDSINSFKIDSHPQSKIIAEYQENVN